MSRFDDPEKAFTFSGERLNFEKSWINLYSLDSRLKGFEMVIASSNNKAVENVSRELPGMGEVAKDTQTLRYFKPMADGLLQQESWGAISAVLGNASNRSKFKNRFWWDKDTGLQSYLSTIGGRKHEIPLPDGSRRPPHIVAELLPPLNKREALQRWQAVALQDFEWVG